MKHLVLYHAECQDGFASAWCAWKKFGDDAEYLPVNYGDPPPDVTDRDVYILDFSYSPEMIEKMAEEAVTVTLLDHHLSAQQHLSALQERLAGVGRVLLSNGDVAYVDAADLDRVSHFSWSRAKHGGAMAYVRGKADRKLIYMHRLILEAPDEVGVDHINRDTLDNRRVNLRLATKQQNAANMDRGARVKGITRRTYASGDKWIAQIMVNGKQKYLGTFNDDSLAGRAYDEAAKKHFGEFARGNSTVPNIPPANIYIIVDLERSGSQLTWDYFHPEESRPWFIDYVADRDLWKFELPSSKEVNAYLSSLSHEFQTWDDEFGGSTPLPYGDVVPLGEAILQAQERQIEMTVAKASVQPFKDASGESFLVPIVNCTNYISEVVGRLAEGYPFAVGWFDDADGSRVYSLRSAKDGVDVAEIAKGLGGGGHLHASGFRR